MKCLRGFLIIENLKSKSHVKSCRVDENSKRPLKNQGPFEMWQGQKGSNPRPTVLEGGPLHRLIYEMKSRKSRFHAASQCFLLVMAGSITNQLQPLLQPQIQFSSVFSTIVIQYTILSLACHHIFLTYIRTISTPRLEPCPNTTLVFSTAYFCEQPCFRIVS